jgi:hypothetical protein
MKKMITLLFACLLVSGYAFNQNYNTALGIKFGPGWYGGGVGLNIKHSLGSSAAIEGVIGGGSHHLWLQGLFEINKDLGTDGLNWYYGIGGDIGFWSNGYHYYSDRHDRYYNGAWGGVDGVIGIEYTFNEIPFNIAIDAVPSVRLFPYVGFGISGNLALRFAIR